MRHLILPITMAFAVGCSSARTAIHTPEMDQCGEVVAWVSTVTLPSFEINQPQPEDPESIALLILRALYAAREVEPSNDQGKMEVPSYESIMVNLRKLTEIKRDPTWSDVVPTLHQLGWRTVTIYADVIAIRERLQKGSPVIVFPDNGTKDYGVAIGYGRSIDGKLAVLVERNSQLQWHVADVAGRIPFLAITVVGK